MGFAAHIKSEPGSIDKDIMAFTLSTCIWCMKTKALMKEMGLAFRYVDMDLLEGADKDGAKMELAKFNPRASYPTLVIGGGATVIMGFDEDKIRELT